MNVVMNKKYKLTLGEKLVLEGMLKEGYNWIVFHGCLAASVYEPKKDITGKWTVMDYLEVLDSWFSWLTTKPVKIQDVLDNATIIEEREVLSFE